MVSSTNIMLLDIIHRPVIIWKYGPVYFSKHNVSRIGFCLPSSGKTYSVEPNRQSWYLSPEVGSIDKASPYLQR
jgi:hypothetical protein